MPHGALHNTNDTYLYDAGDCGCQGHRCTVSQLIEGAEHSIGKAGQGGVLHQGGGGPLICARLCAAGICKSACIYVRSYSEASQERARDA